MQDAQLEPRCFPLVYRESFVENTQVGPFRILNKLGASRRHRVYHARQVEQERDVALKFISIPPDYDWDRALEKLQHEFDVLRELRHPHLARVYGAGVDGQQVFVATELVAGDALSAILSRRGRLAPDLAIEYARQIASSLDYLHSHQLVHCKLTPEKIIVGPGDQLKLTDLRLNRCKRRRWDRTRKRDLELAAYLAPEQLSDLPTYKSDLYSLGVILYEMLTGRLPFEPENIARLNKLKTEQPVPSVAASVMNCPVWLDRLVTQLLQANQKSRPHSARAVLLSLQEIQKMDESQRAAVDQIAGNFNPLNATADREEARELLQRTTGQSGPEKKAFPWAVMGVIVCGLLIFGGFAYLALPPSAATLLARATAWVNSDRPESWAAARDLLSSLRERPLETEQRDYADRIYSRARRRILIAQAENGVKNSLQSPAVQMFIDAFQLEKEKAIGQAYATYGDILKLVKLESEDRYVREEAEIRREELIDLAELPADEFGLLGLIEAAEPLTDGNELRRAYLQMEQITLRYAGREDLDRVVLQAARRMKEINEKLSQLVR